eukprot:SAG31_NODE_12686_length_924_cov_1.376970_1_plen_76_part_00
MTLGAGDVVNVVNVGRLPDKAQRLLSKPVHASQTRAVEAGQRGAVSVDSAERLQSSVRGRWQRLKCGEESSAMDG